MFVAHVRVDDKRHDQMKKLAKLNQRNISDEYKAALDFYLTNESQEAILKDSKIEVMMNERMKKMEDRVVAMQARNGMDTSIILMLVLDLASRLLKVEKQPLYEGARKKAAAYFSKPFNKEKNESKG